MEEELVRTNVSITPKQRDKLKRIENGTGKSMSQLIREAIEHAYPDPPPFDPEISINGQNLHMYQKRDKVRVTDEDFKELFSGNQKAFWEKINKNKSHD